MRGRALADRVYVVPDSISNHTAPPVFQDCVRDHKVVAEGYLEIGALARHRRHVFGERQHQRSVIARFESAFARHLVRAPNEIKPESLRRLHAAMCTRSIMASTCAPVSRISVSVTGTARHHRVVRTERIDHTIAQRARETRARRVVDQHVRRAGRHLIQSIVYGILPGCSAGNNCPQLAGGFLCEQTVPGGSFVGRCDEDDS
jgi:hypothetical protein